MLLSLLCEQKKLKVQQHYHESETNEWALTISEYDFVTGHGIQRAALHKQKAIHQQLSCVSKVNT